MSKVNIDNLSPEALKDIIMAQKAQLELYKLRTEHLENKLSKSESEYEELAAVIMQARSVLSC